MARGWAGVEVARGVGDCNEWNQQTLGVMATCMLVHFVVPQSTISTSTQAARHHVAKSIDCLN